MSYHSSVARIARRLGLESLEPRRMLDGAFGSAWLGAEGEEAAPMPDFGLIDVNPNSASYGNGVSPRDYLDQVTGWYFGSAL